MNQHEHISFNEIEKLIKNLLEEYTEHLKKDTIDAVMHYINHGEYEMAYEGLFIDLIELGTLPENPLKYIATGKLLGLETDSTFDPNFWDKFTSFLAVKPESVK